MVFVVARNQEYGALKSFTRVMETPGAPGLELPDMDIPAIAAGYGIRADRVESLANLTSAVKEGLAGDGPRLVEVPEARVAGD